MPPILVSPHQFVDESGRVLGLKVLGRDRRTYGGFLWPESGVVECPDWSPVAECGNGLHFWPLGLSVGDGATPEYSQPWIVVACKPEGVIDLGGKAKAKTVEVILSGSYLECMLRVLPIQIRWTQQSGAASATGESGAASATGWSGAASATGGRGAAVVTGPEGLVECGPTDIAVATHSPVWWRVHPGSVLAMRTDTGAWLVHADDYEISDGEIVAVENGVVWQEWDRP